MERSQQLKIARGQKVDQMQAILTAAQENGTARSLTTDEQTRFDALELEVRSLDSQITQAEALEARQAPESPETQHQRNGNGPEIMRKSAPYSAGKAIREFMRGGDTGLTGIEAEQHRELSQTISTEGLLIPMPSMRAVNTTTHAGSIDVKIDPNISVLGYNAMYQQMGLEIVEGLQGSFKLGKMEATIATKKAAGAALTVGAGVPTYETASPERFGVTDIFDKELLSQANPAVQLSILNNMIQGCDRGITKEVFDKAIAAATEAAGTTALSHDNFITLMGSVPEGGAFAMARSNFFNGMKVKVDTGSGIFLTSMLTGDNGEGKTNSGGKVFYSDLFQPAENRIIYGSWRHMWLGFWGALEILRNPYTYQKNGQVEMTVNRLAYAACKNSAAFKKSAVIV